MEIRQLAALIAVAEAGSVTRAAEVLRLVQPAVSRQIRTLEDELKAELFERTKQGMVLTDDGKVVLEHARRALRELERARDEVRPTGAPLHGLVTIGLLPSVADPLAEAAIAYLRKRHPAVRLRIMVGYDGHLADWLEAAEIDLAVLYDIAVKPGIDSSPLVEEPLWLVGPPERGLSSGRPERLEDHLGEPFVLPAPPHALRSIIDHAAARDGLELEVVAETNSMSVQRRMAMRGAGLTVLPRTAVADELAAGQVSAAPLAGELLRRRLVLAVPATRRLGPAVRVVADVLAGEVLRSIRDGGWPLAQWIGRAVG
jgi:DNA-binding transcriptional LysR family regulator